MDGADDGNGGLSPDGGIASASPGCTQQVTKVFEIIDCDLDADCSNILDTQLSCIADLPPEDLSLPIVLDACGEAQFGVFTTIPQNGLGCTDDTLFVTRTYFNRHGRRSGRVCVSVT